MDLNFTSIVNSIYQVDFGTGGHIVIYDKDYNLVYTSANTFADSEVTLLKDNVLGTNKVTINNHDFVITQYTISNTTWRVALFSNIDNVRSTNRQFVLLSVLICVIGCAVFSILIVFLVKTVTKPLNELQMAMNEVRNSDYLNYVPYEAKGSNEVEELNDSYNAMMKQIQKLMDNVVEEQNNQRKSEFKALTNQINPHFLYNTLDSIIYLIDEGKNDDAQTMVLALSKFFRISISKGKTIIPLHDEIEHIKNYLIIQKMRYKDAFAYTIKAEEDCLDYQVIKLILQPIVENAIYHGIKDKDKGTIDVYCHKEGEFLKLSVKDNGYGISSAKIAEIRESFTDPEVYNGVGLKNVYQRLKIYYGNKADVVIDSVLDVGTTITLVIPIKEATSNEEK
jgi:two-component system sensor histidine kinase YesM